MSVVLSTRKCQWLFSLMFALGPALIFFSLAIVGPKDRGTGFLRLLFGEQSLFFIDVVVKHGLFAYTHI